MLEFFNITRQLALYIVYRGVCEMRIVYVEDVAPFIKIYTRSFLFIIFGLSLIIRIGSFNIFYLLATSWRIYWRVMWIAKMVNWKSYNPLSPSLRNELDLSIICKQSITKSDSRGIWARLVNRLTFFRSKTISVLVEKDIRQSQIGRSTLLQLQLCFCCLQQNKV